MKSKVYSVKNVFILKILYRNVLFYAIDLFSIIKIHTFAISFY